MISDKNGQKWTEPVRAAKRRGLTTGQKSDTRLRACPFCPVSPASAKSLQTNSELQQLFVRKVAKSWTAIYILHNNIFWPKMSDSKTPTYRYGGRYPGGVPHPDRVLPVWALILEVMEDGRWYTLTHLRAALAPSGVPCNSVKGAHRAECYQRGYLQRRDNPRYDPAARREGQTWLKGVKGVMRWTGGERLKVKMCRYVYRITDEGRAALERARRKYADK